MQNNAFAKEYIVDLKFNDHQSYSLICNDKSDFCLADIAILGNDKISVSMQIKNNIVEIWFLKNREQLSIEAVGLVHMKRKIYFFPYEAILSIYRLPYNENDPVVQQKGMQYLAVKPNFHVGQVRIKVEEAYPASSQSKL